LGSREPSPHLPSRFARDHANSCGMCHSVPYREAGAGQTIASTSSAGRNTPHFYGAGLVEMLAVEVRQQILETYDRNRNGVLDRQEVRGSAPVLVRTRTGAVVDYGDASPAQDGRPRLNPIFRVWYLDAAGRVLPDVPGFAEPRVASFDLAMQPFGWGRGYHLREGGAAVAQGAEASTLRQIAAVALDHHLGLEAFDPSQQPLAGGDACSSHGGLGRKSLNGARQFALGAANDCGRRRTTGGWSDDDPDGDGYRSEIVEGDLDAIEFYMLHVPAPAFRATPEAERGRGVFRQVGCTRCHVESWELQPRRPDSPWAGDRRFFHLATQSHRHGRGPTELVARLVLTNHVTRVGERLPNGGPVLLSGVYSDFKHWDLGPAFFERRFDGTVQREHRTSPLWGVGTTAPYGHSGSFESLESVIVAHDGAAAKERGAFQRLTPENRRLLLTFLESLVLYSTDLIPADVNGDGKIDEHTFVNGSYLGYERFNPQWLFATPPRYEILAEVQNAEGRRVPLTRIHGVEQAYGLHLLWRRDDNADGFPDAIVSTPQKPGWVR
jgi:hypothetical protein